MHVCVSQSKNNHGSRSLTLRYHQTIRRGKNLSVEKTFLCCALICFKKLAKKKAPQPPPPPPPPHPYGGQRMPTMTKQWESH